MNEKLKIGSIGIFKHTCPPVFVVSATVILLFILFATIFTDTATEFFNLLHKQISTYCGWLFTISTSFFVVFTLWILFSRYSKLKLGKPEDEPRFSYFSWLAMLFSAGMGIGLLFWSIAEPITHYIKPPVGEGGTLQAVEKAMQLTFFHWGIHAWAIYSIIGLALAFFAYRKDLPLSIRSAFYPILKDKIYGPLGHAVDIFAVLGTIFGVATSLGLGSIQINAGLNYIAGVSETPTTQIIIIAVITAAATTSVVLGLEKGINTLSKINMWLALVLLLLVLALGPTLFLLNFFPQSLGNYLQNLVKMSFWSAALRSSDWKANWTTFYWAWWIAWSPFVGMFIARISKGRTIKQFIIGVLFVPVLMTFIWLAVFGGTAFYLELHEGHAISQAVNENISTALFVTLDKLPLSFVTVILAIVLVFVFFVTSSDSASFVIDIITSGGCLNPPVIQRVFWAILEGVIAAVLLVAGGLKALQTASITSGLPFVIIMLLICLCIYKGLKEEYKKTQT